MPDDDAAYLAEAAREQVADDLHDDANAEGNEQLAPADHYGEAADDRMRGELPADIDDWPDDAEV